MENKKKKEKNKKRSTHDQSASLTNQQFTTVHQIVSIQSYALAYAEGKKYTSCRYLLWIRQSPDSQLIWVTKAVSSREKPQNQKRNERKSNNNNNNKRIVSAYIKQKAGIVSWTKNLVRMCCVHTTIYVQIAIIYKFYCFRVVFRFICLLPLSHIYTIEIHGHFPAIKPVRFRFIEEMLF